MGDAEPHAVLFLLFAKLNSKSKSLQVSRMGQRGKKQATSSLSQSRMLWLGERKDGRGKKDREIRLREKVGMMEQEGINGGKKWGERENVGHNEEEEECSEVCG